MLRLKPTVISLTVAEVRDTEERRRTQRRFFDVEDSSTHTKQNPIDHGQLPSDFTMPRIPSSTAASQASQLSAENEDISSPAFRSQDPPTETRWSTRSTDSQRSDDPDLAVETAHNPTAQGQALDRLRVPRHNQLDLLLLGAGLPSIDPSRIPRVAGTSPGDLRLGNRSTLRPAPELSPNGEPSRRQVTSSSSYLDTGGNSGATQASPPSRQLSIPPSPPPTVPVESTRVSQHSSETNRDTSTRVRAGFNRPLDTPLRPPTTPARRSSRNANTNSTREYNQSRYTVGSTRSTREELIPPPATGSSSSRVTSGQAGGGHRSNVGPEHARSPTSQRSSRVRVYDDSLPAAGQPRTPQNLPEARHQSRLQGSYTVPIRGASPHPQVRTPTTSRRQRRALGRTPSPPGLQTPGYLGLYGGIENADDAELFEESSRYLDSVRPRTRRGRDSP